MKTTMRTDHRAALFQSVRETWNTPEAIAAAVATFYGGVFDLDPCAAQEGDLLESYALERYTGVAKDGLVEPWVGTVYMNPPYGRGIGRWVDRALTQPACTEVIMLVPARPDTLWFAPLHQLVVCYIRGRLHFSGHENAAPFPSAVIYRGPRPERFHAIFAALGAVTVEYGSVWP